MSAEEGGREEGVPVEKRGMSNGQTVHLQHGHIVIRTGSGNVATRQYHNNIHLHFNDLLHRVVGVDHMTNMFDHLMHKQKSKIWLL